jgi:hypothetical protein
MKRAYINPVTYGKIDKLYDRKQQGLERIIDTFISLRRAGLVRLSNLFTPRQKIGLVAAFSGTMITAGDAIPAKFRLAAQMEDADKYEGNSDTYEYDLPALLRILSDLSEVDAILLLEEIHRFWNETKDPSTEDFLRN